MGITIESSAPYQSALDRSVPSTYAGQLRADLDELQRLRAAQPAPTVVAGDTAQAELEQLKAEQAEQRRHLDAGRVSTSIRLEALVLTAIGDMRAKLEQDIPTNRRHALEERLRMKWEHYKLDRLPDGTVKLPNRKLIKRVLKSQGL